MFDGLKDKLSSFTEDAEEDVDEEAVEDAPVEEEPVEGEAVEQTQSDEPLDTPDGQTAMAGEAGNTEQVSQAADSPQSRDGSTQSPESPQSGDGTTQSSPDHESATQNGHPTDQHESESGTEDGTVGEDGTDDEAVEDDSSRGFREKAKILASGKTVIDEDDLDAHLEELEFALLGSDVELEVTEEILDGVEENLVGETRRRLSSTGNLVRDALREALYDVISVGQFDFDQRVMDGEKPFVIIFTGVNGVGKTTTIAKMAQYFENRGLSTVLANGDTFRAGANEQLEQHARNLDKKIISHEQGSDPAAVIYDAVEYADANDVDVVLGDTAGRLHTNDGLMDQLEKIDRVIDPHMTLFVDEAVAGQDAVNRAREFDEASEIDGSVLTKADADQQGGAAISVSYVTGKPILFLGTGQDYDDLERFDPEVIVDELLGEE
jgi:fused signal recognition particle receptor